jgi:hypothetical protein
MTQDLRQRIKALEEELALAHEACKVQEERAGGLTTELLVLSTHSTALKDSLMSLTAALEAEQKQGKALREEVRALKVCVVCVCVCV